MSPEALKRYQELALITEIIRYSNGSPYALKCIQAYIANGIDLNCKVNDCTPLRVACENDNVPAAKLFIENGTDVKSEPLLLNIACNGGYYQIAELLLAHGADINLGLCSLTPIMIAAGIGHTKVVELLLKGIQNADSLTSAFTEESIQQSHKADPSAFIERNRCSLNQTAADMAVENNHPEIAVMIQNRITELQQKKEVVGLHAQRYEEGVVKLRAAIR